MRKLIPLVLLAATIITGCSAIKSRKAERISAYEALSPQHRALVDQGIIGPRMDTNAVYITWGKPYQVMPVTFPGGERTVWIYTGLATDQVAHWQWKSQSNPYAGTAEQTYERKVDQVARRRTNGWVTFENGRVISFNSYAPAHTR